MNQLRIDFLVSEQGDKKRELPRRVVWTHGKWPEIKERVLWKEKRGGLRPGEEWFISAQGCRSCGRR